MTDSISQAPDEREAIVRGNGNEPPQITRTHIDGPYVTFSDGQMHWLSFPERCQLFLGRLTADDLQRKYRGDHISEQGEGYE